MFTGRVFFSDFILSTLLFGLMLWMSIVLPLFVKCDWSVLQSLISLPLVILLSAYWSYLFHFKLKLSPGTFICQALIGIATFSIFTIHPDLILTHFGDTPLSESSFDAIFNLSYSAIVVVFGIVGGYTNAVKNSPALDDPKNAVVCWWTVDLDLNQHAYLSPSGVRRLKPVFLALGFIGLIFIYPLAATAMNSNPADIKLLVIRLSTMGVALIMYTTLAVAIGEAIHLIQLERQLGKGPFKLYDFDERLKWRHDYVKYHLPTPLRKLNLRFFNKHVEAYERLQNEVKTSMR